MSHNSSKSKFYLVIGLLLAALVAATMYITGTGNQRSVSAVEQASVRMKWFFAGTMVPWFAGVDKGFYLENGIDLVLEPGGPDNSAIKLVASGQDTFGVAGADEVLQAIEQGVPVTAIAVVFKDSPVGFVARADSGIKTPSEWAGKKVEVSYGSNAEIQYRAILKKYGVGDLEERPYTFSLAPFVSGEVDVTVVYMMDQPVTIESQGITLNKMSAKSLGVNPYGDVIVTHNSTLKDKPELVRKFLAGTVKAFKYSIENPDNAAQIFMASNPDQKAPYIKEVWRRSIPYVLGDDSVEKIGVATDSRWNHTKQLLLDLDDKYQGKVGLEKAYTNEYLN